MISTVLTVLSIVKVIFKNKSLFLKLDFHIAMSKTEFLNLLAM